MQSGIKASPDLQTAFQTLLSNPTHRGLLAHISTSPESLQPGALILSKSTSFSADLAQLDSILSDTEAAYVILRQGNTSGGGSRGSDGTAGKAVGDFVAVTYVPDKAPVRSKMLFASTRLTLVRELGTEHFSSTVFATTKAELTPAGWAKHEAHVALAAPLTEEERNLVGIREAEAQESMGTGARRGGHISKKGSLPVDGAAAEAMERLVRGEVALVQLEINLETESLHLTSTHPFPLPPSSLPTTITPTSPRYSLYALPPSPSAAETEQHDHQQDQGGNRKIIFISTCPPSSTMKQKMVYASSRNSMLAVTLTEAGVKVAGKIEAGGVEDVTEEEVWGAVGEALPGGASKGIGGTGGVGVGGDRGFSRPKRPGRR